MLANICYLNKSRFQNFLVKPNTTSDITSCASPCRSPQTHNFPIHTQLSAISVSPQQLICVVTLAMPIYQEESFLDDSHYHLLNEVPLPSTVSPQPWNDYHIDKRVQSDWNLSEYIQLHDQDNCNLSIYIPDDFDYHEIETKLCQSQTDFNQRKCLCCSNSTCFDIGFWITALLLWFLVVSKVICIAFRYHFCKMDSLSNETSCTSICYPINYFGEFFGGYFIAVLLLYIAYLVQCAKSSANKYLKNRVRSSTSISQYMGMIHIFEQ